MPKMKTTQELRKRFRVTGTGKLKREQGRQEALAQPQDGKRKRQLARKARSCRIRSPRNICRRWGQAERFATLRRSVLCWSSYHGHAHAAARRLSAAANGFASSPRASVSSRHNLYRQSLVTLIRAGVYAFRDRRVSKREFRRLWIVRINAACRMRGPALQPVHRRLAAGEGRAGPQVAGRDRHPRPGHVHQARRAGADHLPAPAVSSN